MGVTWSHFLLFGSAEDEMGTDRYVIISSMDVSVNKPVGELRPWIFSQRGIESKPVELTKEDI
jgi:hypothetical protein